MNIADRRREYTRESLDEAAVAREPLDQFRKWFDEALASELREPTAMAVATVGADARPAARMVLLKGYDARGFVFYTNYESRKGRELAQNPQASLLFYWAELERQIRIEGAIGTVSAAESDQYYKTRPLGARIGAWASPQSRAIGKGALMARVAEMGLRHGLNPARPPHWGGYRLAPEAFEFWQGARRACTTASATAGSPTAAGRSNGSRLGARASRAMRRSSASWCRSSRSSRSATAPRASGSSGRAG
jgi:pyridoxamine 5'-phosphate oxidase